MRFTAKFILLWLSACVATPRVMASIEKVVVTADKVVISGVAASMSSLQELRPHQFGGVGTELSDRIAAGTLSLIHI